MIKPETRDKLIASVATFVAALCLLLYLIFGSLSWNDRELAQSIPPVAEEEELFIDPELLNLGEPDAATNDEPAPSPQGEPELSEEQTEKIVVPGEKQSPSNSTEKLVTSTKESDVKVDEPTKTNEKESKISSSMKDKFSPKNGKAEGKDGAKGSGGKGSGVQGNVNGRTFQGCQLPSVNVNKPVTIYVSITVDEHGKVIEARFKSDKGAGAGNTTLRNACVKASYNARWSAKKGEPRATGTLTWNLRPRS